MPAGYGLAADAAGLLPWSWGAERVAAARNYWVATTRPGGRPHAMPVWGVWLDAGFWFATDRRSRKARNLAASPALVVHLESGDEVVILDGTAEPVTDASRLARFGDAYHAKYGLRPEDAGPDGVTYRLWPRVAYAWRERDFPQSATRWHFDDREEEGRLHP